MFIYFRLQIKKLTNSKTWIWILLFIHFKVYFVEADYIGFKFTICKFIMIMANQSKSIFGKFIYINRTANLFLFYFKSKSHNWFKNKQIPFKSLIKIQNKSSQVVTPAHCSKFNSISSGNPFYFASHALYSMLIAFKQLKTAMILLFAILFFCCWQPYVMSLVEFSI